MKYLTSNVFLGILYLAVVLASCDRSDHNTFCQLQSQDIPSTDLEILYNDNYELYSDRLTDSVGLAIAQCRQEINATTYSLSLDSIISSLGTTFTPKRPLEHELLLLHCHQHRKNTLDLQQRLDYLHSVRSILPDDLEGRYYDLLYLIEQSYILFNQGRNIEASIYLHEGLYELSKKDNECLRPLVWDKCILQVVYFLAREEDAQPYSAINNNLLDQCIDTTSMPYRIQRRFVLDDTATYEEIEREWQAILEAASSTFDSLICYNNLAFYTEWVAHNPTKAAIYYRQIVDLYPPNACCMDCEYASASYTDIYPTAKPLYSLPTYCPDHMSTGFAPWLATTLEDHIEQRTIINQLLDGPSTIHLQDYYVNNATTILDIMASSSIDDSLVVNLLADTRYKEQVRQLYKWSPADQDDEDLYGRINNLLLYNETFQKPLSLSDPSYHELYQLLRQLEAEEKGRGQGFVNIAKREIDDLSKLSNLKNLVLAKDTFYGYTLDGEVLLDKLPAKQWQALCDSLYAAIIDQTAVDNIIEATKAFLQQYDWNLNDTMTLITDGSMMTYPWELLTSSPVNRYSSIEQVIHATSDTIMSTALCSYTDHNTLSSTKELSYIELPSAFAEVENIHKILSTAEVVTGYDLTDSRLQAVMQSDLVHIATHGIASGDNRLDNYLVIRDEAQESAKFYAYRFAKLVDVPKVVVLSTCDSGTGTYISGAGVFSLAKVLQAAGCQTVIKSLWAVDDRLTKELMVSMYQHWASGISLAEALARAKKDIQAKPESSHPYYWAGFVLEGNGNMYLQKEIIEPL